jgi:hypothetical protein
MFGFRHHRRLPRLPQLLGLGMAVSVALAVPLTSTVSAAAATPATSGPALTITEHCPIFEGQQEYGVDVVLSGLPPSTTFIGELHLDGAGFGPSLFTTDATGTFEAIIGSFAPVSLVTGTATWSGGTLTTTLANPCRGTVTTISCAPAAVAGRRPTTCTATVSDPPTSAQQTPTGTVSFSSSAAGAFSPGSCTLAGSGPSASCSVSYTPRSARPGAHNLTASYGGDATHVTSSGSTTVTVTRPAPRPRTCAPRLL